FPQPIDTGGGDIVVALDLRLQAAALSRVARGEQAEQAEGSDEGGFSRDQLRRRLRQAGEQESLEHSDAKPDEGYGSRGPGSTRPSRHGLLGGRPSRASSRTRSSNGLRRTRSAPALRAASSRSPPSGATPPPLIAITGRPGADALAALTKARPPMPGME